MNEYNKAIQNKSTDVKSTEPSVNKGEDSSVEELKGLLVRQKEMEDEIQSKGFDKSMHLKKEFDDTTTKIGHLASKIDGPGVIHGNGILSKLSKDKERRFAGL